MEYGAMRDGMGRVPGCKPHMVGNTPVGGGIAARCRWGQSGGALGNHLTFGIEELDVDMGTQCLVGEHRSLDDTTHFRIAGTSMEQRPRQQS